MRSFAKTSVLTDNSNYLLEGGNHEDARGMITFFNSFDLESFKRLYVFDIKNTDSVRAWQGHKIEAKAFIVLEGEIELAWVEIDDFESPSNNLFAESIQLSAFKPQVKIIPGGFANGFKAISSKAKVLVFSDKSLDSSLNDDFRFDAALWFSWDKN